MKGEDLEIIFNNGDSRQILMLPEKPLKIIFLFAEKELILRERYDKPGLYVISHKRGYCETDVNYAARKELKTVSEDKSDINQTLSNLDNSRNVTLEFFEKSSELPVKKQLLNNFKRVSNFTKSSNDLQVINNADSSSVKERARISDDDDDDDDDNDTAMDFGLSCSDISDDDTLWVMSTLNKNCSDTSGTKNAFNEDCGQNEQEKETANAFNANCQERKNNRKCIICLKSNTRGKPYFSFPRDFERSNKWAKISGKKWILKATPTERRKYLVCSDHFTSRDFSGRSRLNYNAVPTQNLPKISESSVAEQQNAETFGRLKTKIQLALHKPDTSKEDSQKIDTLDILKSKGPRKKFKITEVPDIEKKNTKARSKTYVTPVDINCCVPKCTSSKSKFPEYSFHDFPPKNSVFVVKFQDNKIIINLRQEWIRLLKIEKPLTYQMRVCSRHFRESDFIPASFQFHTPRLKNNVIPTQYLPSVLGGNINLIAKSTVESENKEKEKATW